ncbi:MAG: hypothetical protein KGZ83_09210 [Sulfuricella sp.]|nr:hypothetical protein [Sulfuricella sp.]
MNKFLPIFAAIFLLSAAPTQVMAAYSMKITASFPKGTAGEKPAAKYPTTTKTSPCDNATEPSFDAVQFTVAYDATNSKKVVDRDVYLFLFNPEGANLPKFFVLKKNNLGSSFNILTRSDVGALSKTGDIYLPRPENTSPAGTVTTTLMGDSISLQAVNSGVWQLVGIIADSTSAKLDFDDPRTWDAWDVATIVLRKPWNGVTKQTCE